LQVFCAEDHRAQHAQVIGQLAHRPRVQAQAAFPAGPIHLDIVLPLANRLAADEIALLIVPDHLCAAHTAKRAEGGDEVNGFEDIGLPLGIVAQQQMKARRKIDIQPRVIAEIPKAQMGQMHAGRMDSASLPSEDFSLIRGL
jgi:hypothetical protein